MKTQIEEVNEAVWQHEQAIRAALGQGSQYTEQFNSRFVLEEWVIQWLNAWVCTSGVTVRIGPDRRVAFWKEV